MHTKSATACKWEIATRGKENKQNEEDKVDIYGEI